MGHKRKIIINSTIYDTVKEAALNLNVTSSAVTYALTRNKKVKGHWVTPVKEYEYPNEKWRLHDDGFEVSDYGRFKKGVEIYNGSKSKRDEYMRCRLSGKTYLMHIEVMKTFDPFNEFLYELCGDIAQVDHINSVRYDNRLCNLRWVNRSENMKYAKNK